MGCNNVCHRYKPDWGKGEGRGRHTPRYTEDTVRCSVCMIWLNKLTGIENFRCKCCHGKVRIIARAHWRRHKKREL